MTIQDWSDIYVALEQRAEHERGFIETAAPQPQRWPRTTGADAIAIAALVDPHVRALRGAFAVQRRWSACLADIEKHALEAPGNTYVGNRELWRCLAIVCVHLASVEAPLPDRAMWESLYAELGLALAIRNVGPKEDGPFQRFDVKTYSDLFSAQLKYLSDARGFDNKDPEPGMTGAKKLIPRSTNADVVALADYWSKQLARVKEVFGHAGVVARWKAALADVDAIARKGDPKTVYSKNNAFWRDLQNTAIHVSVADEAPSSWDLAIDSIKDSFKGLPGNIAAGTKAAAGAVASAANDLAHGVGKVANSAGKGLFSGFGAPLLVGGGLIGLYLLNRSRKQKEEG